MAKLKATPFDGLLGVRAQRLPKSGSTTVVVAGIKVDDVRRIDQRLRDRGAPASTEHAAEQDAELAERLRQQADIDRLRHTARQAKDAARYQRRKADPELRAKRRAWDAANPDKRREYRRRHRERNLERVREVAAQWARRKYLADPESARAKQREYYQRNRERILAKLAEKRARARAERAQQAAGAQSEPQP